MDWACSVFRVLTWQNLKFPRPRSTLDWNPNLGTTTLPLCLSPDLPTGTTLTALCDAEGHPWDMGRRR